MKPPLFWHLRRPGSPPQADAPAPSTQGTAGDGDVRQGGAVPTSTYDHEPEPRWTSVGRQLPSPVPSDLPKADDPTLDEIIARAAAKLGGEQ